MKNFIGDNINAIRVHFGLSQDDLADAIDASQTTVSAWECGQSTPRKANVLKIMDALPGITFDDIMSEDRGFAKRVLNKRLESSRDDKWTDVPLYGAIAAGKPIEMIEVEERFPIPSTMHDRYPEAFLLKVSGSSMNRVIPNGSYALVNPTKDVVDGKVYAVCVNGFDATIKRVRKLNNGFELSPDSTDPTYVSKTFNFNEPGTETVTVIGRVVYYVLPFDWDF